MGSYRGNNDWEDNGWEDNPLGGGKGGLGVLILVLILVVLGIQLFAISAGVLHGIAP